MTWRGSLVRIASYEVEQLRRRLGEIMERRAEAEFRIAILDAEAESEAHHAATDVEAGWYRVGYIEGWRARRASAEAELKSLELEEEGARDGLSHAFEELKKYEQVAETARTADLKEQAKREGAEMDELGARRATRG